MKTVFMGTPLFAVPSLQMLSKTHYRPDLVISQPDRPKGRKRRLQPPEVKVAAEELGIPVFQPEDINLPENLKVLEELEPDLIITVAYGGFLKRKLRKLPRLGCLNLHPSLLPQYRGAAPINFPLFNGDKITGISIFRITARMDAGPLYWKREIAIKADDNYTALSNRLAMEGALDLIKVVEQIESGETTLTEQDDSLATYTSKLQKEDMFINWQESAFKIRNRIRGLADYPGAVAVFREKRIKILDVQIKEESSKEPGTVVKVDKADGITIATGSEDLLIKKLQPEGKKIMSSQAFNLGARVEVGEKYENGI